MNSLMKNNKKFFSLLLGVLLNSSLHAIKIYNKPLHSLVGPGEVISITFPENDNAMILKMEHGNFDPTSGSIDEIDNLDKVFQRVMDNKRGSWSSKICDISSNNLKDNLSHFVGRERIDLQAKTSLKFVNCLLESPFISITSNKMNFNDCFLVNPQVLNIIGDCPESDYKIIQIIFRDQPEKPTIITGKIDLKDNQTTQSLILSNVKQIRIQFNPQAWNK